MSEPTPEPSPQVHLSFESRDELRSFLQLINSARIKTGIDTYAQWVTVEAPDALTLYRLNVMSESQPLMSIQEAQLGPGWEV